MRATATDTGTHTNKPTEPTTPTGRRRQPESHTRHAEAKPAPYLPHTKTDTPRNPATLDHIRGKATRDRKRQKDRPKKLGYDFYNDLITTRKKRKKIKKNQKFLVSWTHSQTGLKKGKGNT